MAKCVAICNQKGGVGKSTTAVNIGSYIALSGLRTLLVDLDPQGNATISCGVNRTQTKHTIYEVIVEGVPIEEAVVSSQLELFDVIPSSLDLAGAEVKLSQAQDRETVLKKLCGPLRDRYDVLLFDCPPSLGLLTVNALVAVNCAIIPVQCEYLALEGLTALAHVIDLVKQKLNPDLTIGGIVLTMTDFRVNLTKEVAQEVRQFFKELVFETTIPRNVRLAESPSFGKPICLYDPTSPGAIAYQALSVEVTEKIGLRAASETSHQAAQAQL